MTVWTDWREAWFSRFSEFNIKDDQAMWVPDYGWFYVLVVLVAVWMMRP